MLIGVYTCQNATLLEITCRISISLIEMKELQYHLNSLEAETDPFRKATKFTVN